MKIIENLIISVNIKINAILLLHDLGDGDIFQKEKLMLRKHYTIKITQPNSKSFQSLNKLFSGVDIFTLCVPLDRKFFIKLFLSI